MAFAICFLLSLQIPFPKPNARDRTLPDQSWISGQVLAQSGDPVPLATIDVRSSADSSRADQRGNAFDWPGTVSHVKPDGTFRIAVPGGSTLAVCALVPGKPKQCRTVEVSPNDLEVVEFSF